MKKKLFAKVLCCLLAVSMLLTLAACTQDGPGKETTSNNTPNETTGSQIQNTEKAEREAVELTWLSPITPEAGADAVLAAVNEVLSERLNTTLNIVYLDNYNTVVPTMVDAGAEWDMAICGANLDFTTYARRGAFADITGYVDTYLTETKKSLGQGSWEAFSLEGKVMAVPIAKDLFDRNGLIVNETMLEDLGITSRPEDYATFWDVVDWLYEVKAARDAKYPEKANTPISKSVISWLDDWYTFESLVGGWGAALIGANVPGYEDFEGMGSGETVFCVPATEEYREAMKMTRQLVKDGIFPYDATSFDPDKVLFNAGELLLQNGLGVIYNDPNSNGNFETAFYPSSVALSSGRSLSTGGIAINANCEHIDRVLEVIEMLNSDVTLATTMHFGPEGEGWTDTDNDGVIELTEKNSDPSNRYWYRWYGWQVGVGVTTMKPIPGMPADFGQQLIDLNINAATTDNIGFKFDTTNVATELAACTSVYSEYNGMLKSGKYDNVDELCDEFVAKLNANGMEKILTECQAQLDAWRAANGK